MKCSMSEIIKYFNDRVKKLTIWDVKLVQFCAMCIIVIIAHYVPQLMEIDLRWIAAVLVIAAIRPMWAFFVKE